MKRVLAVSSTLAVASALGLRAEQEQGTKEPAAGWSDTDYDMNGAVVIGNKEGNANRLDNAQKAWLCGNAKDVKDDNTDDFTESAINTKAGIQLLRGQPGHGSLQHLKSLDKPHLTEAERNSDWFAKDFDDLFCGPYIGKYRNARANATGYAGVCIRDNSPGYRWRGVVQTDMDARAQWVRFGNLNGNPNTPLPANLAGYQKADGKQREEEDMQNWNYQWGSGGMGNLPANWCSHYMKQFLCHVAFPQYAGPVPTNAADWKKGDSPVQADETNKNQLLVRPVCEEFCSSIMDNCNRHEGEYDSDKGFPKSIMWPFIQRTYTSTGLLDGRQLQNLNLRLDVDDNNNDDREIDESNKFWCKAWNRGFGLAQAGTGVGKGDDEGVSGLDYSMRFCATWEAGSSVMPTLALAIIGVVAVLSGAF